MRQGLKVSRAERIDEHLEFEITLAEGLRFESGPALAGIAQSDLDGVSLPDTPIQNVDGQGLAPVADVSASFESGREHRFGFGMEPDRCVVLPFGVAKLRRAPVADLPEGDLDGASLVDAPAAHLVADSPRAEFPGHRIGGGLDFRETQFIRPGLYRPIRETHVLLPFCAHARHFWDARFSARRRIGFNSRGPHFT